MEMLVEPLTELSTRSLLRWTEWEARRTCSSSEPPTDQTSLILLSSGRFSTDVIIDLMTNEKLCAKYFYM